MPTRTVYLRPMAADAKAQWTEVPAGAAWSTIDDTAIDPAVPGLTDYIESGTNGQLSTGPLTDLTLNPGEVVYRVECHAYVVIPTGQTVSASVLGLPAPGALEATRPTGPFTGWTSAGRDQTLTLAEVNAATYQANLVNAGAAAGACRVHELYLATLIRSISVLTATKSRDKLSRQPGADVVDFGFTADEAFTAYEVRAVPSGSSPRTAGVQIEAATVSSRTSHTAQITDDELDAAAALVDGPVVLKAFVQAAASGQPWSV